MSKVSAASSPFSCRWIDSGTIGRISGQAFAICVRTRPRVVSERECRECEGWEAPAPAPPPAALADVCPRCGSTAVDVHFQDVLVQSFHCTVCNQSWLASAPWR